MHVHGRLVGLEDSVALPFFEGPTGSLVISARSSDVNDVERGQGLVSTQVGIRNDVIWGRDQRAEVAGA